jgi:intein/homing endonuclease
MLKKITILKPNEAKNFSESCNLGIKESKSKSLGIINDDIVFTDHSLDNIVEQLKDDIILSSLSNCNVGWLDTDTVINVDGLDLVPAMKIDQIKSFENLYQAGQRFKNKTLVKRDWLAFFAVFFTKNTQTKIGLMDERYFFDKEDLDFCVRAGKLGVEHYQVLDSYIYHFGGISRKNAEFENYELHHKKALQTSQYYKEKYSKPTFVIWNGLSWKPWDDRNLELGGVGGSEIWCIQLAREMDKLGYRVIVFNDCPNRSMKFGNIEYIHWKYFGEWNDQNVADYFISSRSLEPFKLFLRVREKYLMTHDIWIMLNHPEDIKYHDRVDKFFCLSNEHKKFVAQHHSLDPNRILMTSNGIDFSRFNNIDESKRNKYKIIYSSSPDRGLEVLLDIYPRLKERIPQVELHVYYGFDFFSKEKQAWVDSILQKMKNLGVVYHGKLNQIELAEAFKTSRVLTYFSWFEETFCQPEGSLVFTKKGMVSIEKLEVGDLVLTHKGRFMPILQIFKTEYRGKLLGLRRKKNPRNIWVTPNHKLLVKRVNKRSDSVSYTIFSKTEKFCGWIESDFLKEKKDWLLTPKNVFGNLKQINIIDYLMDFYEVYDGIIHVRKRKNPRYKGFKNEMILDEDFCWVLGYFCAEGCVSKCKSQKGIRDWYCDIIFASHVKEEKQRERIVKFFNKYGNEVFTKKQKGNFFTQKVYNSIFAAFLDRVIGRRRDKKIPEFIFDTTLENQKSFMEGMFSGDGNFYSPTNTKSYCSISPHLAYGFAQLLSNQGILPSIFFHKKRDCYNLTWQNHNQTKNVFSIDFGDNIGSRLVKKEEKDFDDFVYDIKVKEDESYVCENIIVHNCIGSIEAMTGGCVFVGSGYWGLLDTVKDGGILIPMKERTDCLKEEYKQKFIDETVKLIEDDKYFFEWQRKGYERVKRFSWENVANQFHTYFQKKEWKEIQ